MNILGTMFVINGTYMGVFPRFVELKRRKNYEQRL